MRIYRLSCTLADVSVILRRLPAIRNTNNEFMEFVLNSVTIVLQLVRTSSTVVATKQWGCRYLRTVAMPVPWTSMLHEGLISASKSHKCT